VPRTRIADIADGAGLVRQTVYDWVASRDELVDLAIAQRIRELGDQIRSRPVNVDLPLGEQLVDLLSAMVDVAALTDVVAEILEPFFARASEEGVLRDGLGTRALAEWVQLVLVPLRNRRDLGPEVIARQLRYFLLPRCCAEPARPALRRRRTPEGGGPAPAGPR
jgi:AcrR family transcriptional regulator